MKLERLIIIVADIFNACPHDVYTTMKSCVTVSSESRLWRERCVVPQGLSGWTSDCHAIGPPGSQKWESDGRSWRTTRRTSRWSRPPVCAPVSTPSVIWSPGRHALFMRLYWYWPPLPCMMSATVVVFACKHSHTRSKWFWLYIYIYIYIHNVLFLYCSIN